MVGNSAMVKLSLQGLIPPHPHALINQYASDVEQAVEQSCIELGIWQEHFHEYNTMSAYLFPETQAPQLYTIGMFNALLYFIDDIFDRHDKSKAQDGDRISALFHHAMDVFLKGQAPRYEHPILNTAQHLHQHFVELAPSETWMWRFANNSIHHLQSSLEGVAANTQAKRYHSWYEEYVEIRDLDSGMAPTIDLIEFALGRSLDNSIYQNPILREARLYVTRYCALSNDLFSYDKEVVRYGSRFNAVPILQRDGMDFEQAIASLIDNLNEMIRLFQNLPLESLDEDGQIYAEALWQQLVAAYYWQFSTNRYRSKNSSFIELEAAV